MIVHLAATQLFDPANVTSAAAVAGAWTPVSTGFHLLLADHAKQYAWIQNRAVIFIAPIAALVAFGALLVAGRYLDYSVNPLTAFAFFVGHVGGAFGSRVAYQAQSTGPLAGTKVGGLFASGPLNNPADAAQAAKPTPLPPATSDETPPPAPVAPPPPPINPFAH